VDEGSLYPALYRIEEQGLIESEWRPAQNSRTAQAELDGWLRLSGAIARVPRPLEQEA
jgi:DNA-binding PadR family transcriptional regulator